MKLNTLEAAIEAILFASGEAVSLSNLSTAIEQDTKTTRSIIHGIMDKLKTEKRGIQIVEINDSYQMCTNPDFFSFIKILYQNPQKRILSLTLLETLAIIAYKQPITKSQIEEIRGVSADHAVSKLIEYNLVCERGRLDSPGKPLIFGTTEDFLRHYGLKDVNTLPNLPGDDDQLRIEAENEVSGMIGN